MRCAFASVLALVALLSGCGRRAEPAAFDAPQLPAPVSAAVAQPLGKSALKIAWGELAVPPEARAGGTIPLTVTFTNLGDAAWPDKVTASPDLPDGRYAVRLSYSWRPVGGTVGQRSADRFDLPLPVPPGQSATLPIVVRVPDAEGAHELRIELLQELYFWFADHGAPTLTRPVDVRAGASNTP